MKIKVSGLREPGNIRAVLDLGIDMMGFVFCDKSSRNVMQVHIPAGTIPDRADGWLSCCQLSDCRLVGVFIDEMPQNVVTRVYNYHLDDIQLNGNESTIYIDNLRRTLVPDISPDIKIIKTIIVRDAVDVRQWQYYKGHVDMLLFDVHRRCLDGLSERCDLSVLNDYDGDIPFLVSGDLGPDDAAYVKAFHHPMLLGVDLDKSFEDKPSVKNIFKLEQFIDEIRR